MAHNPAWHAEYYRLEIAANEAGEALRSARKMLERKRPAANAQAVYDAALVKARETGKARWDFEMAAAEIVDIATLPVGAYFAALLPNR